jgi:SPP1 gp7 family putative phage head morphogenesis protein
MKINPHSKKYQKAFINYLRKGIPIHISYKNDEQENHGKYIWRTQGDDKVRLSHAENDGKVFSYDDPPETGNPGEDFGCRCWAETYVEGESEFASQELISAINDSAKKWDTEDFLRHFYFGGGSPVTLSEIGHLSGIIDYYFYSLGVCDRVNSQIIEEAKKHEENGDFFYEFEGSYEFEEYQYEIGSATIDGVFNGEVIHKNGMIYITGTVDYFFSDIFTDPADIREILPGSSSPNESYPWWVSVTDGGGKYYGITSDWQTEFNAEIKDDSSKSEFKSI